MKKSNTGISDTTFSFFVHLYLVGALVLALYPLIYVVSASLSDPRAVLSGDVWLLPKDISLLAYERVLKNERIWLGYKNTIAYTVLGTFINVVLTVMAAYPLSRKDFRGRKTIMKLIIFTMFFSGGIIPTYLVVSGLKITNTIWAMVLPQAVTAYNIIITRTFFQTSIPDEMKEAAFIDGCSNIKLLVKIILPLSKAIIAVILLFYGVIHWNSFFNALMYISKNELYPLQLVLREILIQNQSQNMMESNSDDMVKQMLLSEGIKYSAIIVSVLPMLVLYPFLQKYFVKGVMTGAIKG